MAGMNAHYHLSLKTDLLNKLKIQSEKEGICLAEYLRKILSDRIQKETMIDMLQKLDKKLDCLIKKG